MGVSFHSGDTKLSKNDYGSPSVSSLKQPSLSSVAVPSVSYGAGAEARLRLGEGKSTRTGVGVIVPAPEGRMRLEETNQYSASLEANLTRGAASPPAVEPSRQSPARQSPARKPSPAPVLQPPAPAVTTNPFEDDGNEYDESKNPFADDEASGSPSENNDYDNNLNPFA